MDMDQIVGTCADVLNMSSTLFSFDFSVAPTLLYYAYLPLSILTVLVLWQFTKSDVSKQYTYLLTISVAFLGWMLNELLQWTYIYHYGLYLGWQFAALLNVVLFSSIWLFVFQIYTKNKLKIWHYAVAVVAVISTLILYNTPLNISSYDFENCEGVIGKLWNGIYLFESLVVLTAAILLFLGYYKKSLNRVQHIALFGTFLMGFGFLISAFTGDYTGDYAIDLFAGIGMFSLLGTIVYLWMTTDIVSTRLQPIALFFFAVVFFSLSPLLIQDFTVAKIFGLVGIIPLSLLGVWLYRREAERAELYANQNSLVRVATHEMRRPITNIREALAFVIGEKDKNNDVTNSTLVMIQQTNDRMHRAVENFLGSAKATEGGLQLKIETFDAVEVCKKLLAEYRLDMNSKHLVSSFQAPDGPVEIEADQLKIEQVISNFLDNSIKYAKPTGGNIALIVNANDSKVRISVKDDGMGMTAEDKSHMFQKYFRGSAKVKNAGGSGIGLNFVQAVASLHGGLVGCDSPGEGEGSVFWIEIPIGQSTQVPLNLV